MAKEIASDTKTNKRQYFKTLDKIRMPIVMLNAILAGGISFGRVVNCYGRQQSGKSTFSLQTAQYFLEDYGDNCRVVIFDTEASFADSSRLENGFNLSPSNGEVEVINPDPRVLLHFTATIEDTFNMIIKYVKESKELNLPTLIILDSLSTLVPARDIEELDKALNKGGIENSFAGGMMATPRIMGQKISHLLGVLPSSLATVITISQATADMETSSAFAGPQIKAKGAGYALGHAFHLQLKFSILPSSLKSMPNEKSDAFKANKLYTNKDMAADENTRKTTLTTVQITKNKISVCEEDITLCINNLQNGRFVEQYEIFESLSVAKGILVSAGALWHLRDDLKEKYKNKMIKYVSVDKATGEVLEKEKDISVGWYKSDIVTSKEYCDILTSEITAYYIQNVGSVASIYIQRERFRESKGLPPVAAF